MVDFLKHTENIPLFALEFPKLSFLLVVEKRAFNDDRASLINASGLAWTLRALSIRCFKVAMLTARLGTLG